MNLGENGKPIKEGLDDKARRHTMSISYISQGIDRYITLPFGLWEGLPSSS